VPTAVAWKRVLPRVGCSGNATIVVEKVRWRACPGSVVHVESVVIVNV
jgi:hypothetical protein